MVSEKSFTKEEKEFLRVNVEVTASEEVCSWVINAISSEFPTAKIVMSSPASQKTSNWDNLYIPDF